MKKCWLIRLLVGGLIGAATSCQPTSRSVQACLRWAPANAPLDVFDLDRPPTPLDTTTRSTLSYAQRRTLLHDADGVNCCLTKDAMHDSTYVGAYFYATVARLTRVRPAPCQVLIHASMDDFSGLYFVLQQADKPSASLYVAGNEGAGGTEEDGLFHSPRITTGRMLNDSLVQVTTRADCMAFRHSGQHSYTEATTKVFRLDYRRAMFHLIRRQNQHLPLAKFL
jgi:hypothetical protein